MNRAPSLRVPVRPRCSAVTASNDVLSARRRGHELAADGRGILLVVAVGHGGLVLVPVGERRVVLVEHQVEALVVEPEHITYVTGVLQRPTSGRASGGLATSGCASTVGPLRRVVADQPGHVIERDRRRVEAALAARSLEHPGPVLGVRRRSPSTANLPSEFGAAVRGFRRALATVQSRLTKSRCPLRRRGGHRPRRASAPARRRPSPRRSGGP